MLTQTIDGETITITNEGRVLFTSEGETRDVLAGDMLEGFAEDLVDHALYRRLVELDEAHARATGTGAYSPEELAKDAALERRAVVLRRAEQYRLN